MIFLKKELCWKKPVKRSGTRCAGAIWCDEKTQREAQPHHTKRFSEEEKKIEVSLRIKYLSWLLVLLEINP